MPDMKKKYMDEVRGALQAKLGLKNVMQIPKLEKIVVSTGIGTSAERDAFTEAKKHLGAMTGQLPVITKARKNVSNFKLRVGMPVGVMVTLRGSRMYEFLDRFVHNALPRVRDFRGIPKNGFDGVGNYNLGISDVSVFTEVDADKLKYPLGVNVTIVTTAKDDESARELLKMMEVPFEDSGKGLHHGKTQFDGEGRTWQQVPGAQLHPLQGVRASACVHRQVPALPYLFP